MLNAKAMQSHKNIVFSNFLYNLGRLSTYCLIGAVCGGMGVAFEISRKFQGISTLGIGILITIMALLMLFVPKVLNTLEPSLHKNSFLKRLFGILYKDLSYKNLYFIGLLNGFLPCGIVYYFALIALSSGGVLQGIGVMFVFGICTWIPMFFSGMLSGFLMYRLWIYRLSLVLMIGFGLYTIYKGLNGL